MLQTFSEQLGPWAWLWWTAAILYNPVVNILQRNAHLLQPYKRSIRVCWGAWNAALAVFSLCGFCKTFRAYIAVLQSFPNLCQVDSPAAVSIWDQHFTGPAGTWVLYFIVSKLFELGDTLFLAALGKPIIFLHWYHHLSILSYMFVAGLNWHPYMTSGVVWNYLVHAVMYTYYASSCFKLNWSKSLAQKLTALQLTQMVVNLVMLVAGHACCGLNYHISAFPSAAMYAAYACLFLEFFGQKYAGGKTGVKTPQLAPTWQHPISIEGTDYDVTTFIKQHPGGGVIKAYLGKDATAAFKEFHSNSKRAVKVLAGLPNRPSTLHGTSLVTDPACGSSQAANCCGIKAGARACIHAEAGLPDNNAADGHHDTQPYADQGPSAAPATDEPSSPMQMSDDDIMADFAAWRASLVDRGLFKPRPFWQLVWLLLEPLALVAAACCAMKLIGSLACGVVLLALANTRCGWIQHEGGHSSVTGHIKADKVIQTLTMGLGLHLSGWVWNSMHNKHHATPNKVNFDIDLNTLPLVSFYVGCLEKDKRARQISKPFLRWWLRLQAFTFLPFTTLVLMVFWVYYLHPVKALRQDKLGVAVMVLSHVLKPLLFVGFGGTTYLQGYLLTLAALSLASIYHFGHFALSHTFMPVVEETDDRTWVRYAMEHSVDISPGNRLVDWVMGFLNYQVIHHLFPTLPQSYSPIVSRELKDKARKWGIPYTTVSYPAAWREMLLNLHAVGDHYFTALGPATCPAGAQHDKTA